MSSPTSLDVVEDAVRRELGAQERRADAADTRAGFLLAFCGLVVAIGADDGWPPLALAARVLAAIAGLLALSALAMHERPWVEVETLEASLREAEDPAAREMFISDQVTMHRVVNERLAAKEARLRRASALVIAAVAAALLGVTVELTAAGWR